MRVRIELGRVPSALMDDVDRGRLADAVAGDLAALAGQLGLAGRPQVDVVVCDSRHPLVLSVGGRTLACPTAAAEEVWETVAPSELAGLPVTDRGSSWPAAQWLERVDDRAAATRWVRAMAVEMLGRGAGGLLDDGELESALSRAGIDVPAATARIVLGGLLDRGAAIGDPQVTLGHVRRSLLAGRSAEDTLEAAFRLLHRDGIEVSANPGYLTALLGGGLVERPLTASRDELPEPARAGLDRLRSDIRKHPGIDLPDVTWLPAPGLAEGLLAIRINDVSVVRRGLAPSDLLVDDTVERVRRFGLTALPRAHPRTRSECAVVDAAALEAAGQVDAGLTTAMDFAHLLLHQAVVAWIDRLVGVWTLESWLAALDPDFPDLVRTTVARFSICDLTRVVRTLVREGVSVADHKALLDALLLFDTVPAEATGVAFLDDALPVAGPTGGLAGDWRDLVAFARLAMRAQVTQSCMQARGVVIAHRLEAGDRERLSRPLDGTERAEIVQPLGEAVERLRRHRAEATVVTDLATRPALRALVEEELPQVHVVAEPELLPDVELIALHEGDDDMGVRMPLLRDRIGSILESVAPEVEVDDDGDWTLVHGPVRLYVRVEAWGDLSIVSVWCVTNRALPASDELFRWVALRGGQWTFGHLGAFEADDGLLLVFRHTLLGDFLDSAELVQALRATAENGAAISDEVRVRFQESAGQPEAG